MDVVSDYRRLEKGRIYTDNVWGCSWKVTEQTREGAVLQNLPLNGKVGMRICAEPESMRLRFFPL